MIQMAAEIALTHHEKSTAAATPTAGRRGHPLVGRIVAVADVFDALTSPAPTSRPGSWSAPSLPQGGRGSHFDPACVTPSLTSGPPC
jgi:putative two-component system response regulator